MDQPTYEVAELTQLLGRTFEEIFPDDIWIIGEISNLTRSRAGHVYFDLVQPGAAPGESASARMSVVLWDSTRTIVNKLLKRAGGFRMTDAMAVRIRGVIDFYPPQGRIQIRMTSIDPTYTLGQVAQDRELLLKRLIESGATARQDQLNLVLAPQRIGLITSQGSAAEHDFLTELSAAEFSLQIFALHTRVQGDGAGDGLAAAINYLSTLDLDAIVLVRGGGARGDLAAFDAESLALAISLCPHPVICGIGHETDRSIADEVAYVSLKTPTAAAAFLIDRLGDIARTLDERGAAIATAARRSMQTAHARLDTRAHQHRSAAGRSVDQADQRLRTAAAAVQSRAGRSIAVTDSNLTSRAARLRRQADGSLRRT
ncbi:MAG: exodeoxyribonuclease VII large subunit, partial [Acidobacteria bacterium]|nr:exodeoxyribonuclease VII large subunit [Acidobacteriota bacterium]